MNLPTWLKLQNEIHKFKDGRAAKSAFLANYDRPGNFGGMDEMSLDKFKEKVLATKDKPVRLAAGGVGSGRRKTIYTKEFANLLITRMKEDVPKTVNFKVVGSVSSKGRSEHDLDISVSSKSKEPWRDFLAVNKVMKDMGYTKASGNSLGGPFSFTAYTNTDDHHIELHWS